MTQYIADEAHFKDVIERAAKVKSSLWVGKSALSMPKSRGRIQMQELWQKRVLS